MTESKREIYHGKAHRGVTERKSWSYCGLNTLKNVVTHSGVETTIVVSVSHGKHIVSRAKKNYHGKCIVVSRKTHRGLNKLKNVMTHSEIEQPRRKNFVVSVAHGNTS